MKVILLVGHRSVLRLLYSLPIASTFLSHLSRFAEQQRCFSVYLPLVLWDRYGSFPLSGLRKVFPAIDRKWRSCFDVQNYFLSWTLLSLSWSFSKGRAVYLVVVKKAHGCLDSTTGCDGMALCCYVGWKYLQCEHALIIWGPFFTFDELRSFEAVIPYSMCDREGTEGGIHLPPLFLAISSRTK